MRTASVLLLCAVVIGGLFWALLTARGVHEDPSSGLSAAVPEHQAANSKAFERRSTSATQAGSEEIRTAIPDADLSRVLSDDLHVRCVDASGIPVAGIEVQIRALDRSGRQPMTAMMTRRSDEEGLVRFKRVRPLLTERPAPYGWVLWSDDARPPLDARPLDLTADFCGIAAWRMPAMGGLDVTVTNPRGEAIEDGVLVMLEEWDESDVPGMGPPSMYSVRPVILNTEEGVARFRFLGLGKPLVMRLVYGGTEFTRQHLGGVQAGENEVFAFRIGEHESLWFGRAFGRNAKPLVKRALRAFCWSAESGRSTLELRTDAQGHFIMDTARHDLHDASLLLLRDVEGEQSIFLTLQALSLGDSRDLGDLHLQPDSIVVRGVVQGQDGAPCANARIEVMPLFLQDGSSKSSPLRQITNRWLQSDAQGRFSCADPAYPDEVGLRYRVIAKHEQSTSESIVVESPALDLVLRLGNGGWMEAEVLCGADWKADALSFALESEAEVSRHVVATPQPSGLRLEAQSLPPDRYQLTIRASGLMGWSYELDGLEVFANRACSDPRLRAIDLRSMLQRVELVLDWSGSEEQRVALSLVLQNLDQPEKPPLQCRAHAIDRCSLLIPAGRFSGVLSIPGFREQRFDVLAPEQRVAMVPMPTTGK